MNIYADAAYYADTFYNSLQEPVIAPEDRQMYLRKASAFLDSLFVRQKPEEPYLEEVKNACCEIADCFYTEEKREGIVSENNAGYSVTYAKSSSGLNMTQHKAYAIAQRYLANTGLLYRGIG